MRWRRTWSYPTLLSLLLWAAPLAQSLPLAASVLAQPQGSTNASEVDALIIFTNALLPTEAQQTAYGWQLNEDPCGYPTCSPRVPPLCNWKGLSCTNWHVTGIALDPAAQPNTTAGVNRILSPYVVYLQQLQTLQLPGQRLQGPLTRVMGFLSNLQTMDLSSNQLTGFLPTTWGLLSNLATLNLSGNALEGSIPSSWGMMYSLKTLDLTRNPDICSSNTTQPNTTSPSLPNLNPNSSSLLSFPICNASIAAAQAANSASPTPSSPAAAASPPSPSPSPESSPPPGGGGVGYHTSPGINVSVSVLVGGCFLLGLFAGFIRIRGQQRQHRRLLMGLNQQRRDIQQLQQNSPAFGSPQFEAYTAAVTPFCSTPRLVLGPDGQQLALARKFKQQSEPAADDPEAASGQAAMPGSTIGGNQQLPGSLPARTTASSRQTKLYTAVLEVDTQQAETAPTPVDLVSPTDSSSLEPLRPALQPAALQTEGRPPNSSAGSRLSRMSASLSRLSAQQPQPGAQLPNDQSNQFNSASQSSQPSSAQDVEIGQSSQQTSTNRATRRSRWPFRRAS